MKITKHVIEENFIFIYNIAISLKSILKGAQQIILIQYTSKLSKVQRQYILKSSKAQKECSLLVLPTYVTPNAKEHFQLVMPACA